MKLQVAVQVALTIAIALRQSGTILFASASTCASCTTCENEANFYGTMTLQLGACPSGRNAYVSSISIDSPKEDSFTYRTYVSANSTLYYPDCSHDSSPLCYTVNPHECGEDEKLHPMVHVQQPHHGLHHSPQR